MIAGIQPSYALPGTLLLAFFLLLASNIAEARPDKNQPGNNGWKGTPAAAQHDRHVDRRDHDDDDDESLLEIRAFSDLERVLIRRYYGDHPPVTQQKPLPPGLRKKVARGGSLPPGWQMKVAREEVLEDSLLPYANGVPGDLYGRLPPQPDGTVLLEMGGRVVRLIEATRTIVDVLDL